MRPLKILCWGIHGAYQNALAQVPHEWYLPTKPGAPEGYGGRGNPADWPPNVRDVPAGQVRDLPLDLVIYQTPKNLLEDGPELLGERRRELPSIYLEHNTPMLSPVETRHPVDDPGILIVHVTHYNRVMWEHGGSPTRVIEHSVAIDPEARYTGRIERGIMVVNNPHKRGRKTGFDLFEAARAAVPIDAVGIGTEEVGGLGDIPYRRLHKATAEYRFLFSPMRYTSLPLAVVEGMTVGMPIVALATTELPRVLENGRTGYVSCDLDELIEGMKHLLADPSAARRMGDRAREVARERFGMERFIRDWNAAFEHAIALRQGRAATTVSDAPLGQV